MIRLSRKVEKMTIRDFTIVITVHERKQYLKRLLTYYKDFACRKIVVDSSQRHLNLSKEFPQVEFYHYPGVDFFENLYQGISKVKTKYVLQTPDDDFIVKQGIISCLKFLRKHQDYIGAAGQSIHFSENNGKYKPPHLQDKYLELLKLDYKSKNSFNRLKFFFQHRLTQVHVIFKTRLWMTYLKLIRNNAHFYSSQYFEIMFFYLALIMGNYKFLPELFVLRSDGLSVYHHKWFFDKRIHANYNYKNLVFKLWLFGDPISAILAKTTRKNTLFCKCFTSYILVCIFIGGRNFIKHLYLQVAMSIAKITPLKIKLIHRKILKFIYFLYLFFNDFFKRKKDQPVLVINSTIKNKYILKNSPFYKKKYQYDLAYISSLISKNR